ncbi:hypothetical protein C1N62_21145 (plasmid) [Nissabacter sp. SGAir0207]|nr:hypothetical protein C1N62_21145 [Nissabacter sp. SGAir0207]
MHHDDVFGCTIKFRNKAQIAAERIQAERCIFAELDKRELSREVIRYVLCCQPVSGVTVCLIMQLSRERIQGDATDSRKKRCSLVPVRAPNENLGQCVVKYFGNPRNNQIMAADSLYITQQG